MGFTHEFPHSRMFDSDLREILELFITVKNLPSQFNDLKNYVDNYFKELNISNELSAVLDKMLQSGELEAIMAKTYAVYMTLDDAIKSNVNGADGTFIIILSAGDYVKPAIWRVASNGTESILEHKTAGKWIVYADSDTCNVGCLALRKYPTDVTDDFAIILASSYKHIHIPNGDYAIHMNLTKEIIIEGEADTIIHLPANPKYTECITLDSDRITLRQMRIKCDTDYANRNGLVVPNQCDYSTFERLRIENFATAFLCGGRFIWNVFREVEFVGSFHTGLYISTSEPVNTNEFYSCLFNDNVQYGIYFDSPTLSFNNSFHGCNVENNGNGAFGQVSSVESAVYSACMLNFDACYFENNGTGTSAEKYSVIKTYAHINISESCFIVEQKPIVMIYGDNKTNFIGCYQYNQSGNFYRDDSQKTAELLGCNFININ